MKSTIFWTALFLLLGLTACKSEKPDKSKPKDSSAKSTASDKTPAVKPKPQTIHLKKGTIEVNSKVTSPDALLATLKTNKGDAVLHLHKNTQYKEFKWVMKQLVLAKIEQVRFVNENGSSLISCAPQENFQSAPAPSTMRKLSLMLTYSDNEPRSSRSPMLASRANIHCQEGGDLKAGFKKLSEELNFWIKEYKGTRPVIDLACSDGVDLGDLCGVLKTLGQAKITNVCFSSVAIVVEEEVEIDQTPPKGSDMSKPGDK
ncbi:MAG: hypothetical protein P1V97_29760 [Planctomycetota bacterium]|nr:hypothetical protein [Planctomycetota bacterium]